MPALLPSCPTDYRFKNDLAIDAYSRKPAWLVKNARCIQSICLPGIEISVVARCMSSSVCCLSMTTVSSRLVSGCLCATPATVPAGQWWCSFVSELSLAWPWTFVCRSSKHHNLYRVSTPQENRLNGGDRLESFALSPPAKVQHQGVAGRWHHLCSCRSWAATFGANLFGFCIPDVIGGARRLKFVAGGFFSSPVSLITCPYKHIQKWWDHFPLPFFQCIQPCATVPSAVQPGSTADASVYSFTYNCGSSQMCPGHGGQMLTAGDVNFGEELKSWSSVMMQSVVFAKRWWWDCEL